tara:strand:- start:56 stop:292 length:237 start_codon:yes stop_codon:yes gene_type:complete
MGRSRGRIGGGEASGRMAGDILSGVESDDLESQETSDENIMEMPDFDSPTKDAMTGGFLQQTKPTAGGSYLGGARQTF